MEIETQRSDLLVQSSNNYQTNFSEGDLKQIFREEDEGQQLLKQEDQNEGRVKLSNFVALANYFGGALFTVFLAICNNISIF